MTLETLTVVKWIVVGIILTISAVLLKLSKNYIDEKDEDEDDGEN